MRVVQGKKEFRGKGPDKKTLVGMVMNELIERKFFDENQAEIAKNFIVEFLPETIDILKGLARSISEVSRGCDLKLCCW